MHIMEGYLDPIWCAVWFILAIPFIVLGARAIVRLMREHPEQKMTIALSGAFIFLLSSLKLPSATGSSSHPTGTGLYRAPVDTTFALYRPRVGLSRSRAVEAYRTATPYRLKHLPWYTDSQHPSDEERYYTDHCRHATEWSSRPQSKK